MSATVYFAILTNLARTMLLFAAVGIALAPTTVRSQEPIEKLIRQLRQPIPSGRVDAAKQLARYGIQAKSASGPLIECLRDPESDMRLTAAYALGCVQTDNLQALAALVPLLTDADEHVRYSAQWSIAHIAQQLQPASDTVTNHELASVLDAATKEMAKREHQSRHLVAVELALARTKAVAVATAPLPLPEPPTEPLVPPAVVALEPSVADELAANVYAASDLVGRLHFVEQLRDCDKFPDSMRLIVIENERRRNDDRVLRFAIGCWGANGQELLQKVYEQFASSALLFAEDVPVIELLEPASHQQQERLMDLISDKSQLYEIRAAAIHSLMRAPKVESTTLTRWIDFLANTSESVEVRIEAANALMAAGAKVAECEPQLIALLKRRSDDALLGAVAQALARIAPTSKRAAKAVHELLAIADSDDPLYVEIVDACGQFGFLAAGATPYLASGLSHADAYTRAQCAAALESIGPSAVSAWNALVACITNSDESVTVKNAAAKALRSIGATGINKLAEQLNNSDESVVTDVLRALTIAGPSASESAQSCLTILSDEHLQSVTRAAAATALGAMGNQSRIAQPKLSELCESKGPVELRSACLLALAAIDANQCRSHIETYAQAESILLRASASYAKHLTGESRAGFQELVRLLDGSETDEDISRTLVELGSITVPWLIDVAEDEGALECQRLICFGLACEQAQPDWPRLLPLLNDHALGDQFAFTAAANFSLEGPAVNLVLKLLREGLYTPAGETRLASLLVPDGLGAGGDDEEWQGLALNQPSALRALGLEAQSASQPATSPEIEMPAGGSAPPGASTTGPAPAQPAIPIQPSMPVRATAPDTRVVAIAGAPRVVSVFYGTNRSRVMADKTQHQLVVSVLVTAGGGLLAMLLCLIGLVRSGQRVFAAVALLAMGIVAPFGYQAAQRFAAANLHTPVAYGGDYRSEVELGVCEVSIPPGHRPGMLESPNLFKLELKQEIDKHIVLTKVQNLPEKEFYQGLQTTLGSQGKNILVFIHGYNVSFDDAARRTAQMAADLKFPGAPVFYSWPSQANWYGYATDKENIELSVTQIKGFLLDLAAKSGADTINLVAHSMGNVGLTAALKEMETSSPKPIFNQVVLAAPDIDAEVFKNRIAPYIVTKAQHFTLYTSQSDLALLASRYFNNGPRVGDSANGVLLYPGIDSIDATAVDSSLLGHSYYGSNVTVLTDLGRVLDNQPVASRQYLQAIADATQPYWAFDPLRISQSTTTDVNR